MCGVSICSQWILLTKEAKLWCILSCLSTRAVEQTVGMHVNRKVMKLRLCYCYVICNSVIDYITVPLCVETTGHQWIPVARDHWSGALVVQCAVIPSCGFPSEKVISFMFAWTSCSTNNRVASELNAQDAYAMSLLCVICNLTFRMVEYQDKLRRNFILKV